MSSKRHHKRQFTTHDIRRYLEGTMLPAEMHEIEKAALADPFLADAIKGMEFSYTTYGKDHFHHHTSDLRGRLHKKQHSPKLGLVWRVAAVLFVIITGVAISVIIQDGSKQELANVNTVQREEEVSDKDTGSLSAEKLKSDSPVVASNAAEEAKIPAEKIPPSGRQAQAYSEKDENLASEDLRLKAESIREDSIQAASPVHPPGVEKEVADANASTEVSKQLQGRAAGVNVSRAPVDEDTFAQQTEGLDEVVVVAYGISTRGKKADGAKRSVINPSKRFAPLGGWQAFQDYIVGSKQLPDSLAGKRGEVKISFDIGSDGKAENIRVERSLSPQHDAEAVRLLSNGPSWKILKGKKRRLQIAISF